MITKVFIVTNTGDIFSILSFGNVQTKNFITTTKAIKVWKYFYLNIELFSFSQFLSVCGFENLKELWKSFQINVIGIKTKILKYYKLNCFQPLQSEAVLYSKKRITIDNVKKRSSKNLSQLVSKYRRRKNNIWHIPLK